MRSLMLTIVCCLFFFCIPPSLGCRPVHFRFRHKDNLRSPVVIVPGDGGNQLEAKLDKPSVVHYVCDKRTKDYFTLWMNLQQVLPLVIDCWVDNMRLIYNETSRTTINSPGVDIRVPGWGDTATVEWIDPSKISYGNYFASLVEMLVSFGYERNISVRGAPYDFRKAPNENQQYLDDLTNLIEETYYLNGNSKVITIAHSMGNPYLLYFFTTKSQAWKNKFIRMHISLAGPYSGSVKIVKAFASGYNLEQWRIVLPPSKLRKQQRTMTSSSFLLPTPQIWGDRVIVMTAERNYTAHDYEQFFNDMDYNTGWKMYQDTQNLISDLPAPGVEMHCLYGYNISTPELLVYKKGYFPDYQPTEIKGDGDGTVNLRSLRTCKLLKDKQSQAVYTVEIPKADHMSILSHPQMLEYVRKLLIPKKVVARVKF